MKIIQNPENVIEISVALQHSFAYSYTYWHF
jgi:hypothetical protein